MTVAKKKVAAKRPRAVAKKENKKRKGTAKPQRRPRSKNGAKREELRLLVRSSSKRTTTQVAASLERMLGTTAKVEPLYPPPSRPRSKTARTDEFLARVRIAPRAASTDNAFDIAHRVREASRGAFTWVEPDIPQRPQQSFDDVAPVAAGRETPEAAAAALCKENVTPPDDHYWHLREMRVGEAWAFSQQQGRPVGGNGVRVGHLDTGFTNPPE